LRTVQDSVKHQIAARRRAAHGFSDELIRLSVPARRRVHPSRPRTGGGPASVIAPVAQMGFVVTALFGFAVLRKALIVRRIAALAMFAWSG
jgi:hypothetical protein